MKLTILGVPFAKQSFRFTKTGIKYQPKAIKEKQKSVRQQIIEQLPVNFHPFTCPIIVTELIFVFPPLKSFSKRKLKALEKGEYIYKITKPDLHDNLSKSLFDAMEGIVYQNDSQICELRNVKKVYGLKPRIEVELFGIREKI
jgi:Holliday junction resolvase RusA-like endonuclease